jgi:hypothetical protein
MARPRPSVPKVKFEASEDALLLEVVRAIGAENWREVATRIPGRTARQCRERWTNYVNPGLTGAQWTDVEDEAILKSVREIGYKWSVIARCLPGRAKNAVKNRFHILRRSQIQGQRSARPPAQIGRAETITPTIQEEAQDHFAFLDSLEENRVFEWRSPDCTDTFLFGM